MVTYSNINDVITELLNSTKTNWKNETLYSWQWGMGLERLNPINVCNLDSANFKIKRSYPAILYSNEDPLSTDAKIEPKQLEAKTFHKEKKYFFGAIKKNSFLVEILEDGIRNVVTNIEPDRRMFSKSDTLCMALGNWHYSPPK